ncbi:MAG: methylated-DNA--[Clostridia bacterium]|nr:methylated-DNA--[protein]-cysteine S-methyltransferase [Clostridia bacterium]
MKIYKTTYISPLGNIVLGSDGASLVGLWLEGQKYFLGIYNEAEDNDSLEVFKATKRWLDEYFMGKNPEITMPLAPDGTEFQKKVWIELEKIPYGSTVTYGDIAKKLGTKSSQAVGGAVGRNPISIIIPCHRVIGKDRTLTGYAGGVDKKLELLKLENLNVDVK